MITKIPRNIWLVVICLTLFIVANGPAGAQTGSSYLCVHAPTDIAKGNTDAIEVEVIPDGQPNANDGWQCERMAELYDVMGVGLAGVRISNFAVDPPEVRSSALLQPGVANSWLWSINAIGDENTTHNLLVYTYVDDPSRSSGYRSITRVPVAVHIEKMKGSTFEQIVEALNNAKEIVVVLSGLVVAAIALRGQIASLLGGKKKPENNQQA
jgi:hypothetical protein